MVMRGKLFAILLLAGSSLIAGPRWSIGFGFGYAPAPVPVYVAPPAPIYAAPAYAPAYVPPMPGPGYSWIGGYWYPSGPRWAWHTGYWARRPYARSYWVAPRYYGNRYYRGYWRR